MDGIDRRRDVREFFRDTGRHGRVFVVHPPQHLRRGQGVDSGGARVARLREPRSEVGLGRHKATISDRGLAAWSTLCQSGLDRIVRNGSRNLPQGLRAQQLSWTGAILPAREPDDGREKHRRADDCKCGKPLKFLKHFDPSLEEVCPGELRASITLLCAWMHRWCILRLQTALPSGLGPNGHESPLSTGRIQWLEAAAPFRICAKACSLPFP